MYRIVIEKRALSYLFLMWGCLDVWQDFANAHCSMGMTFLLSSRVHSPNNTYASNLRLSMI